MTRFQTRMRCPACLAEAPPGSRYCPACATPISEPSSAPTETSVPATTPGEEPSRRRPTPETRGDLPSPSSGWAASAAAEHFVPGTLLAGRYRIVSFVGRGGMGEVYRADDLKLDQSVALKFLPRRLEQDPARRERFLNEVRVARQIAHPNVCRVHDIGEAEDRHFISMEYVDGEDLGSMLRRIGRPTPDRALQMARQLCAGLAAAGRQGILHRDLKPSNVMIDGRGQVKIMDFGLAGMAQAFTGVEIRVGTPSYMAPEQLAGQEVSTRSDVYALGLVLYELFTGEPVFRGDSAAEIARQHMEQRPRDPSSRVDGISPAIDRAILRCLEKDPRARPATAAAVSAALPGTDPLAAALAAGETPSPELVAEAGAVGGLRPGVAAACLAAFLVALLAALLLADRTQLSGLVALGRSPAVLTATARQIIADVGRSAEVADSRYGFVHDPDYLAYLARERPSPDVWQRLGGERTAAIRFWYRESPAYLSPEEPGFVAASYHDPSPVLPGMVGVQLDPLGRLLRFEAVPPAEVESGVEWPEPDWSPFFEHAGLDVDAFRSVPSRRTPATYADNRSAWEGVLPDAAERTVRIEAASVAGKPVSFRIIEPWTPATEKPRTEAWSNPLSQFLWVSWFVIVLVGAVFVARRNYRLGRGDRKGALRLALLMLAARMLIWVFGGHHVPDASLLFAFSTNLAWSMYRFGLVWIFYVALEPYLRRLWPSMITSWVRALDGQLRDPLVGRDVLVGSLYGLVAVLGHQLHIVVPSLVGLTPPRPDILGWPTMELEALRGPRHTIASSLFVETQAVVMALFLVFGLLLLRLILRRQWPAVAVTFVLMTAIANPSAGDLARDLLLAGLGVALALGVLFRFGLLALTVGLALSNLLIGLPLTTDFSLWYAGASFFVLAVVVGVAAYGFYVSLAGRPVFRDAILPG